MPKASQRKKRGKPWRKPKASEGGRSGPDTLPDLDGSMSRGSSGGRSFHPSGGHFLFRGMVTPQPAQTRARRAEWPQGYPMDSVIRLCRAKGVKVPVER